MKKHLLLLSLLLLSTLVFSINPVSAYKDLKKGKKDKAFETFLKISESDSSSLIANYGLALLYSDSHFSQYNLERSYKYSQKANKHIKYYSWDRQITQIELKDIEKTNIKPIQVSQLKDSIISSIYDNLIKNKTINGFKQFIKDYPDAKEKEEAIQSVYTLAWANTIKIDNTSSYEQFIKEYPEAKQVETAKAMIALISFNEAKKNNTIEAYNEFKKNYPNSSQVIDANVAISQIKNKLIAAKEKVYESAFKNSMKSYTFQDFQDFFKKYPEASQSKFVQSKLSEFSLVTDIDGNIYHTIKIGNQTWMFENLQTTKYNDGTKIDCVKSLTTEKYEGNWIKESKNNLGGEKEGRYYRFNLTGNDGIYISSITEGILYNYAAMMSNKLCPVGWHIPTDDDWLIFIKTFCNLNVYKWNVELTELGQKRFEKEFNGNYVCFASSGGGLCFTSSNHAWSKDGGHLWSSSGKYLYYIGPRDISNGDHGFRLGLDYERSESTYYSYCVRCIKDN